MIRGTFKDYMEYQAKHGVDVHPIYDPQVLGYFYDLCKDRRLAMTSVAAIDYHPHIKLPDVNVWISPCHFMKEFDYELALTSSSCHAPVPKDWSRLLELAQDPKWVSNLGEDFIKEAPCINVEMLRYGNPTVYPDMETHVDYQCVWGKSGIADCRMTFDDYLATLNSKHRARLKTGNKRWSHCIVQRETITHDQIFDWALPNLYKRHQYTNFTIAAFQLLLGYSAVMCGRGDMFTFRDKNTGQLQVAFYHIHDKNLRIFAGSIKNEDQPNKNIGAAILYHTMEQYCKDPNVDWFDPTCVTSPWTAFSGTDMYKVICPNVDAWFGCTLISFNKVDQDPNIEPPYVCSWESPELDHIVVAPDKY